MNARRRTHPDGLPSRVYAKSGSYYWFSKDAGWIKLCRVTDGQRKMLERLAAEMAKFEHGGIGNMPTLLDQYVSSEKHKHREKGWKNYATPVKKMFADVDLEDVDTAYVWEFLSKWDDKITMKRALRAFLNRFFQWCRETGHTKNENPCTGMRIEKPDDRLVYITDAHFSAIRAELESHPMILCLVDLCYLTAQRSTEIRALRWAKAGEDSNWVDRENNLIHFRPSKTKDSSKISVDWRITPEIETVLEIARGLGKIKGPFVIHSLKGTPWSSAGALKVWRKACNRAQLQEYGYTIKDIRAKALTDAQRAGYDIKELKEAAAHADVKTTEIYFKERNVPVSNVRLALPKSA